jgi:hypothetical protein
VTARNLILCSVSIAMIFLTSGCYTVFRSASVEIEPPEEDSAIDYYEFGGDIAFDSYTNDRWVYYLFCPWWEESVFLMWAGDDADDIEGSTEYTGETEVIYGPPPTVEHIIIVPSTPAPAPVVDQPEIRHKPSDGGESEPAKSEKTEVKPSKPSRRGGGR